MQRPSPAARRFYRAFYHWTLLTSTPRVKRIPARSSSRHAFHTSTRRREGEATLVPIRQTPANSNRLRKAGRSNATHISWSKLGTPAERRDGGAGFRITKYESESLGEEPQSREGGSVRQASLKLNRAPLEEGRDNYRGARHVRVDSIDPGLVATAQRRAAQMPNIPKVFLTGSVQTAAEKPFASLGPLEHVVRYRSDSGLMLELALPEERLRNMQKTFGDRLERLSRRNGTRIEIQDIHRSVGDSPDQRVLSILLSGTFEEVRDTWATMKDRSFDDAIYLAKPDYDPGKLPQLSQMEVYSQVSRPSKTLTSLSGVVRRKSDADLTLELSVPDQQWMRFAAMNDINALAAKCNATIQVGEPEQRPCSETSSDLETARSLLISGKPQDVGLVRKAIWSGHKQLLGTTATLSPAETWPTQSLSDKPAPIAFGKTRDDPDIAYTPGEAYRSVLRVPEGSALDPQPGRLVRLMIGNAGKGLAQIKKSSRCVKLHLLGATNEIVIKGSEENVQRAEDLLQQHLDTICRSNGWPTVGLEELRAGPIAMRDAGSYAQTPTAKRNGRKIEDPDASYLPTETYRSVIRLPKPTGDSQLIRLMVGRQGINLHNIRNHTQCSKLYGINDDADFVIKGSFAAVSRAKEMVQEQIDENCLKNQWPTAEFEELRAGPIASPEDEGAAGEAQTHDSSSKAPEIQSAPLGRAVIEFLDPTPKKSIILSIVGTQDRFLKHVNRETTCIVMQRSKQGHRSRFGLKGTWAAVEKAKVMLQERVTRTCQDLGIPVSQIEEIKSFSVADAAEQKEDDEGLHDAQSKTSSADQSGTRSSLASGVATNVGESNSKPRVEEVAIIRIPEPTGKGKLYARIVGLNNMNLAKLRKMSGCFVRPHSQTPVGFSNRFKLHGTRDQIARAKELLQSSVRRACLNLQIPEVEIEELELSSTTGEDQTSMEKVDPKEAARLSEDVRSSLRALTHPVVLITTREVGDKSWHIEQAKMAARGVTVSSFNTVTLHPSPVISFNLKVPSRSWDAIQASGHLRVHLLTATPEGAAIAQVFTQPYEHAHDGFRRLEHMGVGNVHFRDRLPPVIQSRGILANMTAQLLPEQCILVGDHVIVVAKVVQYRPTTRKTTQPVSNPGEGTEVPDALAYARRGYRSRGEAIIPPDLPDMKDVEDAPKTVAAPSVQVHGFDDVLPSGIPDPLSLGSEIDAGTSMSAHDEAVVQEVEDSTPEPVNDPIYDALRATRDAGEGGPPIDLYTLMNEGDEDFDAAAKAEEDEYDLGFERPNYGRLADQPDTVDTAGTQPATESSSTVADGPLWGADDVAREESIRLADNELPRQTPNDLPATSDEASTSEQSTSASTMPKQGSPNAWGLDPSSRRTYSTRSRPHFAQSVSIRHFSTTSPATKDSKSTPNLVITHQVDPSALGTTVADFLGVPDDNARPYIPRMRSLLSANKTARWAERRLAERADELTDEEIAELQHKLAVNDRRVARKLAWNAAADLRLMLDKGRVDFKRARFLEAAIERGQRYLLEDAKTVRELLDQGKMGSERFELVKAKLGRTSEVLSTELMRLRQVVDEEGEGEVMGAEEVEQKQREEGGFDGFKGNV